VACICSAFKPLLLKSSHPKVINITSGLGSISNSLNKKMHRLPPYGTSKVAVNGLTAHLQTIENDRVAIEEEQGVITDPKIRYYSVAPGFLKTAFTQYNQWGKDPVLGFEAVVQLIINDQYEGGTQWEYEEDKMQQIPW
jgi:NAD(P)-dependent dehydrogenase (short-subunit alcohol dehydrogenase family)